MLAVRARRAGAVLSSVLFIAYAAGSRWVALGEDPLWAVLPLILGAGLVCALRAERALPWLLSTAAALLLAAVLRPAWLVYLPPSLLDGMVAWLFARSLRPGRQPLVEQFMRIQNPKPDAVLRTHARQLTWIWTFVMAALGVAAALLALAGRGQAWVVFVFGISYAVMAGLFLLDYLYRRLMLPPAYHASPWAVLQAVRRSRLIRARPGPAPN